MSQSILALKKNYQQIERTCVIRDIVGHRWPSLKQHNPLISRVPEFVKNEVDAFLKCGVFAFGFIRLYCRDCHHSQLLAFSCKTRGFCPSCSARRMSESAIKLTEELLPEVPIRQWVLSFPFFIRYLMAYDPKVVTAVLSIHTRTISSWYKSKHKRKYEKKSLHAGSVTAIQRFGGALNINPHFHSLFLDGVYRETESKDPQFLKSALLFDSEKEKILKKIVQRVTRWLSKNGYIEEDSKEPAALSALYAASVEYRIAVGPRRGEKIQLFGTDSGVSRNESGGLGYRGFNLHAGVKIKAQDREKLATLCRYILRGPLARERVNQIGGGKVSVRFKRPWSSGATHVVYTEEEFIEKLVALVPPRRANLVRYHGVFAPNARLRERIKLKEKSKDEKVKRVSQIPWAELLKRTFGIDPERCKRCGGKLRPIAVIMRFELIDQILESLKIKSQRKYCGSVQDPRGPPREWLSEDYDQLPTDW